VSAVSRLVSAASASQRHDHEGFECCEGFVA
jgi:hypothetical protein